MVLHRPVELAALTGKVGTNRTCPITPTSQCARSSVPQIFGRSPGSGFGCSSSRSLAGLGGARNTVPRFFAMPFPFSLSANGVQHQRSVHGRVPISHRLLEPYPKEEARLTT